MKDIVLYFAAYLCLLAALVYLWHRIIVGAERGTDALINMEQAQTIWPHVVMRHGGSGTELNTFADLEAVVCYECPDCAMCQSVFVGETEDECGLGHGRCECATSG